MVSINQYPSGSYPEKSHGAAKIHKPSNDENVEKLPIRPISSNISYSYHLAKYLLKLIPPLCNSEYTVCSTKDFVQNIPNQQDMIWFLLI